MYTPYFSPQSSENQFQPADEERAKRQRKVENALLSLFFDGHSATAVAYDRLESYVRGELSWEEAFTEFYGVETADQEAALWAQRAAAGSKTDSRWQD